MYPISFCPAKLFFCEECHYTVFQQKASVKRWITSTFSLSFKTRVVLPVTSSLATWWQSFMCLFCFLLPSMEEAGREQTLGLGVLRSLLFVMQTSPLCAHSEKSCSSSLGSDEAELLTSDGRGQQVFMFPCFIYFLKKIQTVQKWGEGLFLQQKNIFLKVKL